MAYNSIDKEKLRSGAKEAAKTLFQKVDDPKDRYNADFVYERRPRTKSPDFDGYPYIHIDNVNVVNVGSTADSGLVEFTVDIAAHLWGSEETDEEVDAFDEVNDQIIYLLTGPEKITLGQETSMTEPNILRNQGFTGIRDKDQPVSRQELEFRVNLHKRML